MPLSIQESKDLLIKLFRLTLATSERRSEDAVSAFSDILDTAIVYPVACCDDVSAISHHDSMYDDMPALVPIHVTPFVNRAEEDEVKLVISEEAHPEISVVYNVADGTRVVSNGVTAPVEEATAPEEEAASADDEEAASADDEEAASAPDEEAASADDEEAAADDEEAAADDEEEGEELQLVPVRIKKVTYWKDELSGDIYQYLPDDECGDKVGTYVDGKPVFD